MMSVISILNQIRNDEIVLPAIQRDFVWKTEQITKLLDSLLRGYPVGIILLWESSDDYQYRAFELNYREDNLPTYKDNSQRKRIKLVIDGQQRLQSLYVALFGTYNGNALYFDVLSGRSSSHIADEKYSFDFGSPDDAVEWNEYILSQIERRSGASKERLEKEYYVKTQDLFMMRPEDRAKLTREVTQELKLDDEDSIRLNINLSRFDDALMRDESLLKVTTIDEGLTHESPSRHNVSDVLEVFVRTNQEGTKLNRSDLIFSMMKLGWKQAAEELPTFIADINSGNSFSIDIDFVIRCLFGVSDLGTKFDLDHFREKRKLEILENNYPRCCKAIRSAVDFIQNQCNCQNSKVLGGYNTIVPLVYYLFHTKRHEVPVSEITKVSRAVYLFGFAKPFTRWGDSRLGVFIRQELRPLVEKGDDAFPFNRAVYRIKEWENYDSFGDDLLQRNELLTHYLIQGLSGAKVHYQRNAPELDHIFPRSVLRKKGYKQELINHYANLWILAEGRNKNKSNRNPAQYFAEVPDKVLESALIQRDMLNYSKFKDFIKVRSERIRKKIKRITSLSDSDFWIE